MFYSESFLISSLAGGSSSTQVSLKAREVLIAGQMPSYEERLVQMEAVLKNSVSNTYYGEQGFGDHRYFV